MRRQLAVNVAACVLLLVQYLLGTASLLGALAIIGAGFNGASFLTYGRGFSSMIMAGLWALALACYVTGAILAARGTSPGVRLLISGE